MNWIHFLSILEHTHFRFTLFLRLTLGTQRNVHNTHKHTRWWTGISPADPFFPPLHLPPSCLYWQRRRLCEEHYKCRVFYYLALKAQYAATVIISTTVLFYKIVKDDEMALPESELEPSVVMEGRARCSIFPVTVAGGVPEEVQLCY